MTTKDSAEEALSLLDIGPQVEYVVIGKRKLAVTGVSAANVFAIFQRFPDAVKLLSPANLKIPDLAAAAPEAVAAIIAAATGTPGDKKAEGIAATLGMETQLDILEAAARLTFKEGFGPFVQRIVALANAVSAANRGRAPDTKSPQESKPSLPTDSDTKQPGS